MTQLMTKLSSMFPSTEEPHATHLPKRSQSRSIPRSQSTCEFSESARFDLPRLLPAACYKELVGYNRTHFKGLPAPDEPSSALYGNSKNLASFVSVPMDTGRIAEIGPAFQDHDGPRRRQEFALLDGRIRGSCLGLRVGRSSSCLETKAQRTTQNTSPRTGCVRCARPLRKHQR